MEKKFRFAHLLGEGIGEHELNKALEIVMGGISTITFDRVVIKDFRLPGINGLPGELNSEVAELIKSIGIGIKGPTRTLEGKGPKSVNVSLRQALDLYANVRPVKYLEGITTRLKDPERLNTVVFRENTEDVYMGIEAKPGSPEAKQLLEAVRTILGTQLPEHYATDLVGVGIKLMSKRAGERIMDAAIQYAIKHNLKKIVIMHKGNIMKHTEGFFKETCIAYALEHYYDKVYVKGSESDYSEEERAERIFIDVITADDIFDKIQSNPERFQVIVTMNLNGDYVSDAAAGQVGGAPLSASGNIGKYYAVFEAIGGTADDIAGKNIANPTAIIEAFAMMLDHAGFTTEAQAIRDAIADLVKAGIGTADMKFANGASEKLSTTEFAERVSALVAEKLKTVPEVCV